MDRITRTLPVTVALAALAAAASAQIGGPAPLDSRTAGLLIADSSLDTIYFTKDRNGDGDALDPGEHHVFFNDLNNSFILTTGLVEMFQSRDGSIYVGDSDGDYIIRLFDANGDNDAMDEGESSVFFESGVNGFLLSTPVGIWEDDEGYLYVVNAGAGGVSDSVLRLKDLNGDGDAHDEGEATLFFDTQGLVPSSSAFGLVILNGTLYISDTLGGDPDAVIRAADEDGSGEITFDEFNVFVDDDNTLGVQIGFPIGTDGTAIFTMENSGSQVQSIWRLEDLNASNTIDLPSEVVEVWNDLQVPTGPVLNNVFDIAFGPGGRIAVTSNGSDIQDNVFMLIDKSVPADGDFLDDGETTLWASGTTGEDGFIDNARAVEFIRCASDLDNNGLVDVFDLLAFLDDWFGAAADWNADNTTDVFDLLAFLDAWFNACT